jgi:aminoglycoside 2'-N-acetyltransferase I
MVKDDVVIVIAATEDLTAAQRSSVIDVCVTAHEDDVFLDLFSHFTSGGRHFLAYRGSELVSHAVVSTRWVQPESQRVLKTAYVDAVATQPMCQGRGFASAIMRRLGAEIDDYEIACLQTDRPAFYERLGWEVWRGALAGRAKVDWSPRLTSAASWCSGCRRRRHSYWSHS